MNLQPYLTSGKTSILGVLVLVCGGTHYFELLPPQYSSLLQLLCATLVAFGLISAKDANVSHSTTAQSPTVINVKSLALLVCLFSSTAIMACSADQQAKVQQVEQDVVKINKALIMDTCKANPAAISGVGIAQQFIPDPRAQAGLAAAQVGLSLQEKVCQSLGL